MPDEQPTGRSIRDRLAIALDFPDLDRAEQLAKEVSPWFGVAKVGLELYSAAGPEAISRMRALDLEVFADIKLHDIPTTVGRAARVLGRQGIRYLNFHAAGGTDMLRAGVEGLAEGARDGGFSPATPIAVTVLTSDPDPSAFPARLQGAVDAGCDGVVCSAFEVAASAAAGMRTMVPGIRPAGAAHDDQARVATPAAAIANGASWLVIGRAVTAAPDPAAAAASIHAEVEAALAGD